MTFRSCIHQHWHSWHKTCQCHSMLEQCVDIWCQQQLTAIIWHYVSGKYYMQLLKPVWDHAHSLQGNFSWVTMQITKQIEFDIIWPTFKATIHIVAMPYGPVLWENSHLDSASLFSVYTWTVLNTVVALELCLYSPERWLSFSECR